MKLTVCFCPRPAEHRTTGLRLEALASALTVYGPGFNCGKLKRPASSVIGAALRSRLGADDRYRGAGMAPPLGSVTVPTMALVVSPCAEKTRQKAARRGCQAHR